VKDEDEEEGGGTSERREDDAGRLGIIEAGMRGAVVAVTVVCVPATTCKRCKTRGGSVHVP
jgi:hypothetical protein